MNTMNTRSFAWLSIASLVIAACAAEPQTRDAKNASICWNEPGDSPSANSGKLSDAGKRRVSFALDLSLQAATTRGAQMLYFTGPPDATALMLVNQPACTENTVAGMVNFIEGPKGLRARGFRSIRCYPETRVRADIPAAGEEAVVERPGQGDGWYCVIFDKTLDAGFCVRDLSRCRVLADQPSINGECEQRDLAYCSRNADETNCFPSAESCVHLSPEGSDRCEADE